MALALALALAVVPVASVAQESSGSGSGAGVSPGGSNQYDFSTSFYTGGGAVKSVDLTESGQSSGTVRLGFNLVWNLESSRTELYATLSPYYNRVFVDDAFSTFGTSAGLGMTRRSAPRRTWNLNSRFAIAPDQNIPQPKISGGVQDPNVRALVPRNGFFFLSVSGGVDLGLTSRSELSLKGRINSRRYNVYDVATDIGDEAQELVDQRSAGADLSWGLESSERNSWRVGTTLDLYGLGEDPDNPGQSEKNRLRVTVGGSWTRALTDRSDLSLGTGISVIGTGNEAREPIPTLDISWDWSGKRLSSRLSLYRNQGIFPGSGSAVDATQLAGDLNWNWNRQAIRAAGGWAISRGAGDDRGSADTRTRNFFASYTRQVRSWGWFITAFNFRQSSETNFASDVVSTGVAGGLSWQLTGVPS